MTSFVARKNTEIRRETTQRSFWQSLLDRMALARQRRALQQLDDHLLHDVGLTRDQAREESRKPVWDVPAHWSK